MHSGTEEPECPPRLRTIWSGHVGTLNDADATTSTSAAAPIRDGEPEGEATKAVGQATIHHAVSNGATFGVKAYDATDGAASIAVN